MSGVSSAGPGDPAAGSAPGASEHAFEALRLVQIAPAQSLRLAREAADAAPVPPRDLAPREMAPRDLVARSARAPGTAVPCQRDTVAETVSGTTRSDPERKRT